VASVQVAELIANPLHSVLEITHEGMASGETVCNTEATTPPWHLRCSPTTTGDLVGIGTHTLLAIPAVCVVLVTTFAAPALPRFASVIPASEQKSIAPREEIPTDLYGNEVRAAVARYQVDPTGEVFEEHSPDTEVPRLSPPKS
jgi:hypothetical protein